MSKILYKIVFPIVLATLFTTTIFIAIDYDKISPEFYFVLVLVVITIFFFGYATGERFASPIRELIERGEELSDGNFSKRIYLNTKDELEDLARIYNKLAQELEDGSIKQKNTEGSVDMKVRARTQSLEETIQALEQKIQNRTIELERTMKETEKLKQQLKEKEAKVTESPKNN